MFHALVFSFLILFQLKRAGIELIILALFGNELIVVAAFDDSAVFVGFCK